MTKSTKNGLGKISKVATPKVKKSVYERSLEIPDGTFNGLLNLLEPHEIGSTKKTR